MGALPSDELVRKLMRCLTEKYRQGRVPIVRVDELIRETQISEDEYRSLFSHFFHMGVFKPIGRDQLQLDSFINEYAPRLDYCSLADLLQFSHGRKSRQRMQRILPAIVAARKKTPSITVKALLTFGDQTKEGQLVEAVALPWFEIMRLIEKDPNTIYEIEWWKWEEIIAGAYKQAGFDEVILTPRSGDKGRDVTATKSGVGSIRFFDQMKAYKPGHLVTAEEVRAMIGVITGAGNVSKGVITTTSEFASRVQDDEYIKPFIPYRLELKPRDKLLHWLELLSREQ